MSKVCPWEKAWDITVRTMGYTNHTVLPEALEKWSVELLGHVLPRHLQIILEINHQFLEQVARRFPNEPDRLERMSIIEEGPGKCVRMPNLALIGSHAVNGVAALHTAILKNSLFKDFHEMFPNRIQNITNGVTPRIWLKACNPDLSHLITEKIGAGWLKDLSQLKQLLPLEKDPGFCQRWAEIKQVNKSSLADFYSQDFGTSGSILNRSMTCKSSASMNIKGSC